MVERRKIAHLIRLRKLFSYQIIKTIYNFISCLPLLFGFDSLAIATLESLRIQS